MKIEKVKIPSTKGNLAATIHYPEKKKGWLAILCPGYLDSKDYKHLVGLAEKLCKEGYTVIRFDPTGTWESEGDISDYTVTQNLEDIKKVLEYMLHEASYKHILLGGHSRGGQLSLLYAARDQRISAVLGIMPSAGRIISGQRRQDWEKTGISVSHRDLPDDEHKKREFRVPFSHVLDKDKYSAVQDAGKIKVPIVLIAGGQDDMVPLEDIKDIFKNANKPKKFFIIPNISHNYRFNESEIAIANEKILNLLSKNIPD